MADIIHMPGAGDFKDSHLWQAGMELVDLVHAISESMRQVEGELSAQLRGAVYMIPAKIANGHVQGMSDEHAVQLAIADGSLAEVQTYLTAMERLGMNTMKEWQDAQDLSCKLAGMIGDLEHTIIHHICS